MMKKIKVLTFLIILPNLLAFVYDKLFRYSGNWFEDKQNLVKMGLLIISLLGSGWLAVIAYNEKKYVWLLASLILLILLIIYLYLALAIISISF